VRALGKSFFSVWGRNSSGAPLQRLQAGKRDFLCCRELSLSQVRGNLPDFRLGRVGVLGMTGPA
jgi:hypothetical protein